MVGMRLHGSQHRLDEVDPNSMAEATDAQTSEYEFTRDWFSQNVPVWRQIISRDKPTKILEIGSFVPAR